MTTTGGPPDQDPPQGPYSGDDWLDELAEQPTGEWPALTAEARRVLAARQAYINDAVREASIADFLPRRQRRLRFLRWLYERGGFQADGGPDGGDDEPAS